MSMKSCYLLGYNAEQSVEIQPTFRRIRFDACYLLHAGFLLGVFLDSEKMEETCFSETSVDFQRATRHFIPEIELFEWLFIRRNRGMVLYEYVITITKL
jgi:hypothetical protein